MCVEDRSSQNDLVSWEELAKRDPLPDRPPPQKPAPSNSRVLKADHQVRPFSHVGRFLSSVGANRRMGTAQIVGDGSVLLTSAHMVRDKDGTWLSEFSFAPNLADFAEATITSAVCVGTKSSWVTGADGNWNWPADFAFLRLEQKLSDEPLEIDFTGENTGARAVGFPLDFKTGQTMMRVDGTFIEHEGFPGQKEDESLGGVISEDPRFGLGASGGAWFGISETSQISGKIFGVNATNFTSDTIDGPVLRGSARSLMEDILGFSREPNQS